MADIDPQERFEGWFGRQNAAFQKQYLGERFSQYEEAKSSLGSYPKNTKENPLSFDEYESQREELLKRAEE